MSMKLNVLGLLSVMAAMEADALAPHTPRKQFEPEEKLTDEQKQIKYYQSKGLQKFSINGQEIWARNYKNALRKSKL